jgi:hypothetical protein
MAPSRPWRTSSTSTVPLRRGQLRHDQGDLREGDSVSGSFDKCMDGIRRLQVRGGELRPCARLELVGLPARAFAASSGVGTTASNAR